MNKPLIPPPDLDAGDLTPQTVAALIAHDDDWHEQRRNGIGGSDAIKIMTGEWLPLWEEKTGRAEGEDLSDVLPVVMGTWTEPLNRYWFEKQTGMRVDLTDTSHLVHPEHPFMRANLDGRVGLAIFEAKHVNAFAKPEEVREKYYAQCQHNMAVTSTPVCYLSALFGTQKWEWFAVDEDPAYQAELLSREFEFWGLVRSDTPPPSDTAPGMAALPIDDMREVDMTGDNQWASWAGAWLDNRQSATTFAKASKELKSLMEDDVKRAFGHGLEVNRSRNGALRIKEIA